MAADAPAEAISRGRLSLATIRSLRLATGAAIAMAFAVGVNWPGSFIMPLLVAMLLAQPGPPPGLAGGIKLLLAMAVSLGLGLVLLPMLLHQTAAGLILIVVGLLAASYYGANGGAGLVTTLLTVGVTVVPMVGSESVQAAQLIAGSLLFCSAIALPFVSLAHLLFPEPADAVPPTPPEPEARTPMECMRMAVRATIIVMPVLVTFLVLPGMAAYAAVLIKVAQMGQQASQDASKGLAQALIASTLIGGAAALVFWYVIKIWPSFGIYTLLTFLFGLFFAGRIFEGQAVARTAPVWSYALVTALIIVCPALGDTANGDPAGARFMERTLMFLGATGYGALAIFVYDRFRKNPH